VILLRKSSSLLGWENVDDRSFRVSSSRPFTYVVTTPTIVQPLLRAHLPGFLFLFFSGTFSPRLVPPPFITRGIGAKSIAFLFLPVPGLFNNTKVLFFPSLPRPFRRVYPFSFPPFFPRVIAIYPFSPSRKICPSSFRSKSEPFCVILGQVRLSPGCDPSLPRI